MVSALQTFVLRSLRMVWLRHFSAVRTSSRDGSGTAGRESGAVAVSFGTSTSPLGRISGTGCARAALDRRSTNATRTIRARTTARTTNAARPGRDATRRRRRLVALSAGRGVCATTVSETPRRVDRHRESKADAQLSPLSRANASVSRSMVKVSRRRTAVFWLANIPFCQNASSVGSVLIQSTPTT